MELSRRQFLWISGKGIFAMGTCSLLGAVPSLVETSERRPNIVFILGDDWGWGDLGCYGNPGIKTPNLDKLASQGLRFTQFYVNSPVCSPTRTGIMTGQFPSRHRVFGHFSNSQENKRRNMPGWLDPKVVTLPRLLKTAGYVTGHFGKWHLGSGETDGVAAPEPSAYGVDDYKVFAGNGPGWNRQDPEFNARSSEYVVDEAIRFIEANKSKPFFVNVWLKDLHAYLDPNEEQMAEYPDRKGAVKVYYSAATHADKQIGRLLSKLDDLGLTENTVVIFTTDNGPEEITLAEASHSGVGSTGPFRGRKRSLYEGGIRTPFIVRWPGRTPAGKVDNTSVISGVDMLPSLCAIAGVTPPPEWKLDGEDMSSALRGNPKRRSKPLMWDFRYYIFGHVLNRSPMLAIRDGDWKLLMNPDRSRVELYDIPNDPSELDNMAAERPQVVKTLSKSLLDWFESLPEGLIEPKAGKNDYPWPK